MHADFILHYSLDMWEQEWVWRDTKFGRASPIPWPCLRSRPWDWPTKKKIGEWGWQARKGFYCWDEVCSCSRSWRPHGAPLTCHYFCNDWNSNQVGLKRGWKGWLFISRLAHDGWTKNHIRSTTYSALSTIHCCWESPRRFYFNLAQECSVAKNSCDVCVGAKKWALAHTLAHGFSFKKKSWSNVMMQRVLLQNPTGLTLVQPYCALWACAVSSLFSCSKKKKSKCEKKKEKVCV